MIQAQTLNKLKQEVPKELVKQREGWKDRNGNVRMVDYVEWHTVADILDQATPDWSHAVRSIVEIGNTVVVVCAITVEGTTREGVGTGSSDNEMGIKKAEHDALKRAAVKFGIARELYHKEFESNDFAQSQNSGGVPSPTAKSLGDLVTPKQLGMIRALARETNVDADDECESLLSCKTDELSKKGASAFIQHLQDLQAQRGRG